MSLPKFRDVNIIYDKLTRGLFKFLCTFIPLPWMQRFAAMLAPLIAVFPSNLKLIIERNLDLCKPELSEAERKPLIKNIIKHTLITGVEMPYMFFKDIDYGTSLIQKVYGADDMQRSLDQGKGVLMVGSHIGCWEVAILFFAKTFPTHILYTPPKKAVMDKIVYEARTRYGVNMHPATPSGVKGLFKALRNGEFVVILTDQVPPAEAGANYIPFYGQPARTMNFPAKLYKSCKPDVYHGYSLRAGIGRYVIHFDYLNDQIDANIQQSNSPDPFAESLNQVYEQLINQYPEQYQWGYKRFKMQPPGQPDPYAKKK